MKIYVVTSGCYSDYGIRAVFTSRAKANKWIANSRASEHSWYKDDLRIEEWDADTQLNWVDYTYWHCGIFVDSGEFTEERQNGEFGVPYSGVEQKATAIPAYKNRLLIRCRSHKSKDHARKIAVEARQAHLRENA